MLFTQIMAFIVVMVIFTAVPAGRRELSWGESLAAAAITLLWLAVGARLAVVLLRRRLAGRRPPADPVRAARPLAWVLNLAAIGSVALMAFGLDLKAHLYTLPLVRASETVAGLAAVFIYLLHLVVIWHALHPLEREVYGRDISARDYVLGQLRFVAPVTFPWLLVTGLRDLLLALWPGLRGFLDSLGGELLFLGFFFLLMVLFFPPLVRHWWGCRPLPQGPLRDLATRVLDQAGVKVGQMLYWPILGGRLLTAGILGVAPGLRYLLVTPALDQALDSSAMAAVVAHEAGHVRHRHMLTYLVLFVFFLLSGYALHAFFRLALLLGFYGISSWPEGLTWLATTSLTSSLMVGIEAVGLVLGLLIYVRFVMGYFMRHFERQADFFALTLQGSAEPLIRALETVARLSGNIRDLPSWHHFSVAQRVDALRSAQDHRGLVAVHKAKLKRAAAIFAMVMAGLLGSGMWLTVADPGQAVGKVVESRLRLYAQRKLEQRLQTRGSLTPRERMNLAILRFEHGQERQAISDLEGLLARYSRNPELLNTLAWVLATARRKSLRNPQRALALARLAIEIKPAPHIWDTLAEAFFINGQAAKAVAAIRAALAMDPKRRRGYYQRQLDRFQAALKER